MNSRDASKGLLAGVDLGGSKVAVLVTNRRYDLLGKVVVPTAVHEEGDILSRVEAAVRHAVEQAGAGTSDLLAVGMGVPGWIDPEAGLVLRAVNLGWKGMPVGETLSARLDVPCLVENDLNVAALGVQRFLGSATPRNMAYVAVGTGIGAGLILDGRIYRGEHGLAGEIGHMIIEPGGVLCGCGARGCLEALASGPAIAAMGEEAAESDSNSLLASYRPVTAEAVYRAAGDGDEAAREIVRKVSAYLALTLQQLIMIYDPEGIVLGGGVSHSGETFLRPIQSELARLRKDAALTGAEPEESVVRLLPPDFEAGAWGGIALASDFVTSHEL